MTRIMAGITQKELKKPYFHCGPFRIRKTIKVKSKDFKETKTTKTQTSITYTYVCTEFENLLSSALIRFLSEKNDPLTYV